MHIDWQHHATDNAPGRLDFFARSPQRHNQIADAQAIICRPIGRVQGSIDLQDSQVIMWITTQQPGADLAAVRQSDLDIIFNFDHVMRGHDEILGPGDAGGRQALPRIHSQYAQGGGFHKICHIVGYLLH